MSRAAYWISWGEVSEDSNGTIEWRRPIPVDQAQEVAWECPD
jgi:hypothetical protein